MHPYFSTFDDSFLETVGDPCVIVLRRIRETALYSQPFAQRNQAGKKKKRKTFNRITYFRITYFSPLPNHPADYISIYPIQLEPNTEHALSHITIQILTIGSSVRGQVS